VQNSFIVGFTGGSGSGKTFFLSSLIQMFSPDDICFISQDNYYFPREQQPKDHNNVTNFDLPESIDFESYIQDINQLKAGQTVERKEYTFNNEKAVPKDLIFKPSPIIIVEGIFVLSEKRLSDLLDLKIFIDAKDHIKLKRRIIRDNDERGYDLEDVLYRYEHHVIPTFEKYTKPYKDLSDLVIPNNSDFDVALQVLVAFLKTKVS
jgi:uridine kinase